MLHHVLPKQVAAMCSTDALTIWTQQCTAESIQTAKEYINVSSAGNIIRHGLPAQVAAICSTDALTVRTDQTTSEIGSVRGDWTGTNPQGAGQLLGKYLFCFFLHLSQTHAFKRYGMTVQSLMFLTCVSAAWTSSAC